MRIDRLLLESFRNYERERVEFSPGINVITGQNAQGKTNLLESVYYLSCGHGFRTRFDKEIIRFGAEGARLTGEIFSHGRQQEIIIRTGFGLKKQALCNGVKIQPSELPNSFRVVLFSPDDLGMIRDGARERRSFLDMAISQLRPAYYTLISEYSRLYERRKRIINDWREKPTLLDMLEEYTDSMDKLSARIIRYRAAYVKRLKEIAIPIHAEFSGYGEELSLEYKTVSTVTDPELPAEELYNQIRQHSASHREAEIASGHILTGIHKDELEISINGIPARSFASQGQTRTAALSLKMAERELSLDDTGENPVLLLDDVLSELDTRRQEYVLNRIGGGQTLISCCEDEQIKERTGGRIISVSGGKISSG